MVNLRALSIDFYDFIPVDNKKKENFKFQMKRKQTKMKRFSHELNVGTC